MIEIEKRKALLRQCDALFNFTLFKKPICVVDKSTIVLANETFLKQFNRENAECEGETLSTLFDISEAFNTAIESDFPEEIRGIYFSHTNSIKKVCVYEISVWRISFEGSSYHFCCFEPYVDQKATFDTLLQRQVTPLTKADKKYNSLYNHTFGPFALIDSDGTYKFMNKACADLIEYTPQEVIGKHYNFFSMEEFWSENYKSFNKAIKGEIIVGQVLKAKTKSGEKWVVCNLVPDREEQEMLLSARDISHIVALEERLNEIEGSLQRKEIALVEVLKTVDSENEKIKKETRDTICASLLPLLTKLKEKYSNESDELIESIFKALSDIIPEKQYQQAFSYNLSRKETEVCHYIKQGFSNKKIAELLNVKTVTIESHRRSIRQKLDLANKGVNLTSYLRVHF